MQQWTEATQGNPSRSMTDPELIRRVRTGDEGALAALYRRYLPSVWRFAYWQLGGDRHAAEDVVSETFLAAVDAVAGLDPQGGSLSGWLIGIARHKLADHWRRTGRRRVDPAVAVEQTDAAAPDDADPPAMLEAGEQRGEVARVMHALADDERLVLEWKYVDGLSVREIAARLGRTEKAVESLLLRARRAFRAKFERTRGPVQ